MFCPECKAEYRQGFTHCVDCDVDLVYELPLEPTGRPTGELDDEDGQRRLIWKGHNEEECVFHCRQMLNAQVPYKVAQIPESRAGDMRVIWRYEIGVLETDYERAKELLGIEGEYEETRDGPDDEETADDPGAIGPLPLDDSPPDEPVRNDAYLQAWYPEDAIIEVWAQDGDDISGGIEMALKENLIHCRLERENGVRKVFVLPEDEPRATQIVREIIEGIESE
jgi:hypothetical protein